ncbi:MAG: carbonic anhydrase [Deltaproteobacteria bacterium]|nr:carbonic anhydrase [Deltaproteobacteria bacterium]
MSDAENPKPPQATYQRLLDGNRRFVARQLEQDPEFFKRLAKGQGPKTLWVGCSDSRVPANEITDTLPGEIFVHRNVANMVVHTDLNLMSVLEYAVHVLKVEDIIVCGHYGCGGVAAALNQRSYGLLNKWLRNIKDVYRIHRESLRAYVNPKDVENRMVELNVVEQVYNLSKTTIIQKAWQERGAPVIHGWVYDVADGLIKDLGVNLNNTDNMDEIYRLDFSES